MIRKALVVVAVLVAATTYHALDTATMSPDCRARMTDSCLTDMYGGHTYGGQR